MTFYYDFFYEYLSFNGKFILSFLDKFPKAFIPHELFGENHEFDSSSRQEIGREDIKFKGFECNRW